MRVKKFPKAETRNRYHQNRTRLRKPVPKKVNIRMAEEASSMTPPLLPPAPEEYPCLLER